MRLQKYFATFILVASLPFSAVFAQQDPVVTAIIKEAHENSQLKRMSHELMDGVGPRLVGSSKMVQASDWAIAQYQQYGIPARREDLWNLAGMGPWYYTCGHDQPLDQKS